MRTQQGQKRLGMLVFVVVVLSGTCPSADWPMWRCDAGRRGASPENLPKELHLQWSRAFPPAQAAWPNEQRLHFDASYEPVVMGKQVFVASPNHGSVSAFDTETGQERWRFYAEGPVRFAPVAAEGKVYLGSDDGFLYCLRASDGSLLWKVRGAPTDRPDRRHLGNGRLISFWPVRGGPVLADRVVYFGAGIWPTLGVFILAVEAESGEVLWRNGRLHHIENIRIDHNYIHEVGLSPQGYLVLAGDKLLVPNGRSMPAALDPKTGELAWYCQGYRNGDCRVAAEERYAFIGEGGVVRLDDGREVGSRWRHAGPEAPLTFDAKKFHLFEGPIIPYKLFPACNARSALHRGIAYGSQAGAFYAYQLHNASLTEYKREFMRQQVTPWRWDVPLLWKLETEQAKQKPFSSAVLKAGNHLYGHAGKVLLGLELPFTDGPPRVVWQQQVEGAPSSMIAGDGKLFVVTKEGGLYCFGPTTAPPTRHATKPVPLPNSSDPWAVRATEILRRTGATDGYSLVLGLGTGRLMEELLQQSPLRVIGVDADAAKVRALRDKLVAAGLYGTRAELFVGHPFDFPFPPYLASLIVSEGLDKAAMDVPVTKVFEILRPYGGIACFEVPAGRKDAFTRWVSAGNLECAKVDSAGGLALLRRLGPLPGSAPWTHEAADAARTFFSRDQRLKPPLGILWYGDVESGLYERNDYDSGLKPQVVGGRVFAFQMPTKTLFGYDAYTGLLCWKQRFDRSMRYASMDNGIYVAVGDRCVVYDLATGRELAAFQYDVGQPAFAKDIRVLDDLILIAVSFTDSTAIGKGLWDCTTLVALDRKTGKLLWKKQAEERFNKFGIALGRGMVFCIDSPSPTESEKGKLLVTKASPVTSTLMALDARTGETKWTRATTHPFRMFSAEAGLGIRGYDDWVAYCAELSLLLTGKSRSVSALEAQTGKPVWQAKLSGLPIMLRGKTFLNQAGALFDSATGRQLQTDPLFRGGGGCNYAVASEHLVLLRHHTAAFVEIATGKLTHVLNIRSGCSNSLIAADGLLNAPNFSVGCMCNYPLQTFYAMAPMPEVADWSRPSPAR